MFELGLDSDPWLGRIGYQNNRAAAGAIGLKRCDRLGQRGNAIVHTAPQIDEQRLVLV